MKVKLVNQTQLNEANVEITIKDNLEEDIEIDQIQNKPTYDKINVTTKVITTFDPVKVSLAHTKQDIIIADATGVIKPTSWNEDINKLEDGESYKFPKLQIKSFRNTQFLSTTREGFQVTKIPDIGNVANTTPEIDYGRIEQAKIVGVNDINKMVMCVKCTKKITIEDESQEFFTSCKNCNTFQAVLIYLLYKLIVTYSL